MLVFLPSRGYSDGKAGFSIVIKGEINPYKIFTVFLLPEEEVNVDSELPILLTSTSVNCLNEGENKWSIRAPKEKGAHTVIITNSENAEMQINAIRFNFQLPVMVGRIFKQNRVIRPNAGRGSWRPLFRTMPT